MELQISVYCVDLHIVDPCLFNTSIGGYLRGGVEGGGGGGGGGGLWLYDSKKAEKRFLKAIRPPVRPSVTHPSVRPSVRHQSVRPYPRFILTPLGL
jgi:hypothetical protein